MKALVSLVVVIVLFVSATVNAQVKLDNSKKILSADKIINPRRMFVSLQARLSPDGKYLLHRKLTEEAKWESGKLFMLELESMKEIEIPIPIPSGWGSVFTSYNFFSPDSKKLALVSNQDKQKRQQVVIYDIETKKKSEVDFPMQMAQFDNTGKNFFATTGRNTCCLYSIEQKTIKGKIEGWVHSCNPHLPYACVFAIKRKSDSQGKPSLRFKLINLETMKQTDLPVYAKNAKLDDITSHWSLDGRYVLYVDSKISATGKRIAGNRVWDVQESTDRHLWKIWFASGLDLKAIW